MTYALQGFDEAEPETWGMSDFADDRLDFTLEAAPPAVRGMEAKTAAMLMDMYADMAAEADSEEEADAFLPLIASLAPMALRALAPAAKAAFSKLAPTLARGALSSGRTLLKTIGQKGLAAVPEIMRGVAADNLKRVANGQPVTGEMVMRSAARRTLPFLQDPQQAGPAAQRCRRRTTAGQGKAPAGAQPRVPQWCC